MTKQLHEIRFPGETEEYRAARDELLQVEVDLRKRLEEVAAMRRKLPLGGRIKEDYVFEEMFGAPGSEEVTQTKLSELFVPGKDSLLIYSFMYGPRDEHPCPMCTSFLDGLNGSAPHLLQRVNLAVVAKSPITRLREWAGGRGWKNLRLLSSEKNGYNDDYHAQTSDGQQLPACNVFTRTSDGIHHFYSTEVLYANVDGQPRHVDLLWPIWNFFDLTPEGRGADWYPRLSYD